MSAYHEVVEGGRVQFGHSKDDPTHPQIKIMSAALDPLGMPLATEGLSGEQADDGLYIPIIKRVQQGLNKAGVLMVGDCKMSALAIRGYLRGQQHFYLSPLPLTGTTAKPMPQWISQGIAKAEEGELEPVVKTNAQGQEVLVAQGYEVERTCRVPEAHGEREWQERVLVIHSPAHGEQPASAAISTAQLCSWPSMPVSTAVTATIGAHLISPLPKATLQWSKFS